MKKLNELALLVQHMRDEQKAYFATRNSIHLNNSKRLEKEVDEVIKSILSPDNQLKLI